MMDSWIGILGVCFQQMSISFALQFCPILFVDCLHSLVEYHIFSDPGPKNDLCLAPNLFAQRETS